MTAEVLREAASLMRERAEAVNGSYWYEPDTSFASALHENTGTTTAQADVEHIASWDPAVALAVADWLEDALDTHLHVRVGNYQSYLKAVNVARAYLGT